MNKENMTNYINHINVKNIRNQIEQKKQSEPYYATEKVGSSVLTDYDSFPYERWFRGDYKSSEPIIAEREAGWRSRHDFCYVHPPENVVREKVNFCFEAPCSVVYPCYPNLLAKFADRNALNVAINNACVTEYR